MRKVSHTPLSVDDYRARITALVARTPVVATPLADCVGLVLAEDLVSPVPLPPFDNSAMDGYAVRAADVAAAGEDGAVALPVAADIPAGRTDVVPLEAGTAHRIMTGAPIPPGADAVVKVEDTDGGQERVVVRASVAPGTHVRRLGEDVAAGATVLGAGTVLGPPQLGLASAVGRADLPVHRRVRVLVLATGTELVEPGKPLLHGQIYESNSALLAAAVREIGGEPTVLRFVPDDVAVFRETVAAHAAGADLLVTSGGVSAGAYEVVKDALAGQGVEFLRVAMQPGGPQGCGRFDGLPVVTLPGNPVSTALSFELFLRPALLAAMGHRRVERPRATARTTVELRSPAGKRQYRRGRHSGGSVTPVGGPGSHLLASFAASDCLIAVPEDVTVVPAGEQVELVVLR
ncbi:molybdopterin molybdenumtransferase [Actinophytocola xinjiangensis]|uniref:Molybdopterin molybdenumtransferase n=1 Tax=Actinophytocola xinjiangensis TaxID=485602 RepID=A0A7Z0WKC7_9PSEU|nr:gephyrin-like molybdotransferase Glp [Actinophytocola xinjiangensis]OLF09382.1 molybdopterin molybdenumtransferase [Actinophytocola xinjiangensis]